MEGETLGLFCRMNGTVYILQSRANGRFYVGSTTDLNRRIEQHARGQTSTTRRMGEFDLVFSQEFATLELARKAELKLKSWKRKDYLEKIVNDGKITSVD